MKQLHEQGWNVLIVWECTIKASAGVPDEVLRFLGDGDSAR